MRYSCELASSVPSTLCWTFRHNLSCLSSLFAQYFVAWRSPRNWMQTLCRAVYKSGWKLGNVSMWVTVVQPEAKSARPKKCIDQWVCYFRPPSRCLYPSRTVIATQVTDKTPTYHVLNLGSSSLGSSAAPSLPPSFSPGVLWRTLQGSAKRLVRGCEKFLTVVA